MGEGTPSPSPTSGPTAPTARPGAFQPMAREQRQGAVRGKGQAPSQSLQRGGSPRAGVGRPGGRLLRGASGVGETG